MPSRTIVQNYKDLRVWQQAKSLAVPTYRITPRLPSEERFGMGRQMRDAARSVSSNIAEGNGRMHRGDYFHHLSFSSGSLNELGSITEVASELRFLTEADCATLSRQINSVSFLLLAPRRSLQN